MNKEKVVTLRELNKINNQSIEAGYNRNVYFDVVFNKMKETLNTPKSDGTWRGMNTRTFLVPLMVHNHKGGEKCEAHMRCEIYTHNAIMGMVFLDVPMDTFNSLTCIEEVKKEIGIAS